MSTSAASAGAGYNSNRDVLGKFAPGSRADPGPNQLDGAPAAPKLQPWGEDLDDQVDAERVSWATDLTQGSSAPKSMNVAALLDVEDEDLVTAYGKERGDYLSALSFDASIYEQDFDSYNNPDIGGLVDRYPVTVEARQTCWVFGKVASGHV